MAVNAETVQIATGPTASWVHHAAAGVQGALDISAVAALGVVWGAVLIGVSSLVAGVLVLTDDRPPSQ